MGDESMLESFLNRCYGIQNTLDRYWITAGEEGWSEVKFERYRKGVIFGLYREHDPELISLLSVKYDRKKLYTLVCNSINEANLFSKRMMSKAGIPDNKAIQYSYPDRDEDLAEWYKKYNYLVFEDLSVEDSDKAESFLYVYLAYLDYKEKRKVELEEAQPEINKIYSKELEDDFLNWGLIPIVKDVRAIETLIPPRIIDLEKKITIMLELPRPCAEVLKELWDNGFIGKLSVRGQNSQVYQGIMEEEILCEDIEAGRVFSWNIDKLPEITKFYEAMNYKNQLWISKRIKKDISEITFEELCDDFSIEDDFVTTKIVHMEYEGELISHIDYEKVFYTVDEYDNRYKNGSVKGTGKKRRKFFKVNNARIPLSYECRVLENNDRNQNSAKTVPFIYFILNSFFDHKDLLREYFESII